MSMSFLFGRDADGQQQVTIVMMELGGKTIDVTQTNRNFGLIMQSLKDGEEDEQTIYDLWQEGSGEQSFSAAVSSYDGASYDEATGNVYYNGEQIDGRIVEAIRDINDMGLSIESHLRFIENLMENPSKNSVDQLYNFVNKNGLTITEDGHLICYKVVKQNFDSVFTDRKTGKPVNWGIGVTVKMARNKISDNPRSHCSAGLHVGGLDYARSFHHGGRILLVKINPRDVVSVPNDLNTKIRICEAVILKEYHLETALPTAAVYNDQGEATMNPQNLDQYGWEDEDWDEGWDDLDFEDPEDDIFEDEEDDEWEDFDDPWS